MQKERQTNKMKKILLYLLFYGSILVRLLTNIFLFEMAKAREFMSQVKGIIRIVGYIPSKLLGVVSSLQ